MNAGRVHRIRSFIIKSPRWRVLTAALPIELFIDARAQRPAVVDRFPMLLLASRYLQMQLLILSACNNIIFNVFIIIYNTLLFLDLMFNSRLFVSALIKCLSTSLH